MCRQYINLHYPYLVLIKIISYRALKPSLFLIITLTKRYVEVEVSQFVRASNGLGLGKVIEVNTESVTVSYFDSPMRMAVQDKVILIDKVKVENLLIETVVYYYDLEVQKWSVGRVVGPTPPPADYRVQFPNDKYRDLAQADIYVRWDQPLSSPVEWLASQQTYTPLFQEARVDFQNCMLDQREACAGITAALSSSIALEPHQLAVVRRVLSDPIQRYLLADEVGLGKTIEAGLILRQHILDNPLDHKVLVLVPESLQTQWNTELSESFHLYDLLGDSVIVQSYEQYYAGGEILDVNLVVIDEAHHIAEKAWSPEHQGAYQAIAKIAHLSEKLLLLSATPLVGNERNFLAMLHLLDAKNYHLTEQGVVEFRDRIVIREQLGGLIQSFTTTNTNLALRNSLQTLLQLLNTESELQTLSEELLPSLQSALFSRERSGEANLLVRKIRSHIANRHGVHHRLLRNRRSSAEIGQLLPGLDNNGLERLTYDNAEMNEALEAWHQHMLVDNSQSTCFASIYQLFVEASLGSPQVLTEFASVRLAQHFLSAQDFFLSTEQQRDLCSDLTPGESELLEQLIAQGEIAQGNYLQALEQQLKPLINNTTAGVVIFCDHPWSANQLYIEIGFNFPGQIQRHNPKQPLRFGKDSNCRLLICDRRAEEGINLHGGRRVAIHYDIPLSPNRIEQRNGRMNRYAANQFAAPVRSVVIEPSDKQSFATHWLNIIDCTFEMFKQSIAGLQFIIEEQMNQVTDTLFLEGIEAFLNLDDRLVGAGKILETEWTKIRNLEALMSVNSEVIEAREFADKLQMVDDREEEFKRASKAWINRVLGFQAKEDRYVYLTPENGGRATMVNVRTLKEHCLLGFDSNSMQRQGPVSYEMEYFRDVAQKTGKRVARLGEPFHDAMLSILPYEERGLASAMIRINSRLPKDYKKAFFCFEYIATTEFELSNKNGSTLERISDQLMPPKRYTLWLDNEGIPVDPAVIPFLEKKYSKYDQGGSDINLAKHWSQIDDLYSKELWQDLCFSIEKSALQSITTQYQDVHGRGKENLDNYLASDPNLPESYVLQLRQAFERPSYKCLAARTVFLISDKQS